MCKSVIFCKKKFEYKVCLRSVAQDFMTNYNPVNMKIENDIWMKKEDENAEIKKLKKMKKETETGADLFNSSEQDV